MKPLTAAVLLLGLLAANASAQNVYRCGESYSNQPCPGGTVVITDDPRSAAQRSQTDAATRRNARSAQVLEMDRLRQEGQPAQAIIPPRANEPTAAVTDRTWSATKLKKPELFTAVAPRKPGTVAPKKKKKGAGMPAAKKTSA